METEDQKKLKQFIDRRHPKYADNLTHWNFLSSCYMGGRQWFDNNIFKYIKEGDKEYKDRIDRAYRFNHSREIVDLISKYIFKSKVNRNDEDASPAVKKFLGDATLGGLNMKQYSRHLADKSSIYGRVWIVVDSDASGIITVKDEKKTGAHVYSYIVKPQDALDMSFDEYNRLNWILIHEVYRDDEDPITSSGEELSRYRLWTRNEWILFEDDGKQIEMIDSGEHGLGEVPVFPLDHISTNESLWDSPSLINDIAYLDRANANYLSNLDAIIQDQTFSQLAMPAQGLLPGEESHQKLIEMGTKRVFTYDGEGGSQPFYLSPDVKQAELIVTVVKQIINEIYHTVGVAGERTKQDNAVGIDNSSGVAKAYDFERVNALLTAKSATLQECENNILRLVNKWAGQTNTIDGDLILYPETFDVRGLSDEFDISAKLSMIQAPLSVRKHQMVQLVEKLFPRLKHDLKEAILKDIQDWDDEPVITEKVDINSSKIPTQGTNNKDADQE